MMISPAALIVTLVSASLAPDEMTPGVHKNIPCDGNSKWSWNVYIPDAYGEKKEKKFPVVWCSTATEKASFWKLERWADENEALLISFNNTKNGMSFPEIGKVQDDVIATAEKKLRLHPCLRFSTGASGGAAMSLYLASRHGDKHAGVVMQIHSIEFPIEKHISVAYICGGNDKNIPASSVRAAYQNLKNRGNPVRCLIVPSRGHKHATLEELTTDLSWMFNWQRLTHPKLSADDKKAVMEEVNERAAACVKNADPQTRLDEAKELLALPNAERMKVYKTLLQAWFTATAKLAKAKDPAEEHEDLFFLATDARSRLVPSAEVQKVKKRLDELRRDEAIKKEYTALKLYLQAKKLEESAGSNPRRRKQAQATYKMIAQKYPDTRAGKLAAEAAE